VNFTRIEVYASIHQFEGAIRHHKMLDLYQIIPRAAYLILIYTLAGLTFSHGDGYNAKNQGVSV
jgi:hypothetical protein